MSATAAVYLACVAGVAVSIVLPILRGLLPKPPAFLDKTNPWFAALAYSFVLGLVIVMGAREA